MPGPRFVPASSLITRSLALVSLGVLLCTTPSRVAQAQTMNMPGMPAPETGSSKPASRAWYDRIHVGGSIDMYYDYNTNSPNIPGSPGGAGPPVVAPAPSSQQLNQLQNWTFRSSSFSLPLAELVVSEDPDMANSPIGFKVVLAYGDATEWIHGFYPGENAYRNLLQANASYVAVGKSAAPVTITAGKFTTWIGEEVIESQNNFNYTRGLLFSWAMPYYHTGISVNRPFGKKLSLTGYLLNGWNNVVDNNSAKSVGLSANLTVSPRLAIMQNLISGPETTGDEGHWRTLSDTMVTLTPGPQWTFVLNYDYGHDHPGQAASNVQWQGCAGYIHYNLSSRSAAAFRAEIFSDPQGFMTGFAPPVAPIGLAGTVIAPPGGQELKEATLTYEYRFHPRLTTRFEVRRDWSTQSVYARGPGTSKDQMQFIIGNVVSF